jgi:hypothetical protein
MTEILRKAIEALDAETVEREALLDILHTEGFGGREDRATDETSAREIAEERLDWYRGQIEEGLR